MIHKFEVKVSQFYWLPILGSILGVTTIILCYFITILNGYFEPILPFISHTAIFSPSSLIFGLGITFTTIAIALSILLWKFDSDNFIESAFEKKEDSYQIRHSSNPSKTYQKVKFLNKVALAFASLAIITFLILAQANVSLLKYWSKCNFTYLIWFQTSSKDYRLLHNLSAFTAFFSVLVFFSTIQITKWNLFYHHFHPKLFCASLTLLIAGWLSFLIFALLQFMIYLKSDSNPNADGIVFYETLMTRFFQDGPLRVPFVIASFSEWLAAACVFALCFLLKFDIRDSDVILVAHSYESHKLCRIGCNDDGEPVR